MGSSAYDSSGGGGQDMGPYQQQPSRMDWWLPENRVQPQMMGGRPQITAPMGMPPMMQPGGGQFNPSVQNWWMPQGQLPPPTLAPPVTPPQGPTQEEIDAAMAQANYLSNLSGNG